MIHARRSCLGPHTRRQSGVGLVEVLVAVLVLSVGMLGLVGLQMRALRNNQSSHERGMAVVQTHSIADLMRADRANAMGGSFNVALGAAAPNGSTFAATALATWRTNLIAALGPDATGSIACNNTLCTIIVRWNDQRGSGGNPNGSGGNPELSVQTQVQL